ncbi:hypothetical protein B0T14DRAFT_126668 [Immersiella caudata]|uniref:Uncharacterized protein n=1 Tax=Immersiella caudata TaxID=314043 RepID=A0AA39X4C5_9PEZI|nr:hypothetical protein B0T14DRAFT_126668 [Immersiella caudata]
MAARPNAAQSSLSLSSSVAGLVTDHETKIRRCAMIPLPHPPPENIQRNDYAYRQQGQEVDDIALCTSQQLDQVSEKAQSNPTLLSPYDSGPRHPPTTGAIRQKRGGYRRGAGRPRRINTGTAGEVSPRRLRSRPSTEGTTTVRESNRGGWRLGAGRPKGSGRSKGGRPKGGRPKGSGSQGGDGRLIVWGEHNQLTVDDGADDRRGGSM